MDDYKTAKSNKSIFWKVVVKADQEGQREVYRSREPGDTDWKLYRIGETTLQEREGAAIMILFPFAAARAFAADRTVCILKGWTQTLWGDNDWRVKNGRTYSQDGLGSGHFVDGALGGVRFCRSFHPEVKVYDYSVPVTQLTLQDIADIWRVRVKDIPGTDREKMELLRYAQKTLEESGEEYFRRTLGPIGDWQRFLDGDIP
jgi:hypothetical protein